MAEGALCQALYSWPRWWNKPCARRFIPKLVGARMLLPRPFHLPTSIWRTFFPNLPAMPRVPGLEAVCAPATVRNGLSSYSPRAFHHLIAANSANRCGHSSKTPRPFQQNTSAFSAKHSCLFNETLLPFQRNATAFTAKHLGLFSETLLPFQRNALVISAKRSCLFTKTPRPFHQNAPAFSAKHLGFFSKKRHRTEQGFSLCPARCLDVQTIVRCLLLADLAHRQVGCGSSHKD